MNISRKSQVLIPVDKLKCGYANWPLLTSASLIEVVHCNLKLFDYNETLCIARRLKYHFVCLITVMQIIARRQWQWCWWETSVDNIRDMSIEEGKSLAESEGLFFMETSALDSTNVKTAFEMVIREIYNNVIRKVLNSDTYKAELSVKLTLRGLNQTHYYWYPPCQY
jgi:hypothetical protein